MQVVNTRLDHSALTLLLNGRLNLGGCLCDGFLNSRGVNTSVKYKLFKGHAGDFAPNRVKARKGNRLGRVVDNKVYSRSGFEGADITSLSTYDSTLHFVIRQSDSRNGHFRGMVGGTALNRLTDNAFCKTVGILF